MRETFKIIAAIIFFIASWILITAALAFLAIGIIPFIAALIAIIGIMTISEWIENNGT